jgi:hypothetical protein
MSLKENPLKRSIDLPYTERYTDNELYSIIDQGMIYMCACPAQVAEGLLKLRQMIQYQLNCAADPKNDTAVHDAIAKSTIQSHHIMEDCLDTVIALEKWDRATLQMPEGLRQRQLKEVQPDA